MKVTYFEDTDSLYIEFRKAEVLENVDYDENTFIDVDVEGQVFGITLEHAKHRVDLQGFSFEYISRYAA